MAFPVISVVLSFRRLGVVAALAFATLAIPSRVAAQQSPARSASPDKEAAESASGDASKPTASTTAPTVEECLSAHREAQSLRKQFRLLESRNLFAECSHAACPGPVKRDCLRWVDEVASQLPSVVFRLEASESESARNVKVYVDDELRFQVVPNRAVEFNPGTYRFRFVMEGKPPVEQEVVLGEAEKFKNVTIKFASESKEPDATATSSSSGTKPLVTPPNQPAMVESRPVPLATYIFAGVGAAAMINFAAWGLSSKSLMSDLEDNCAPNCEQKYVDRVRLRAVIADVSLGVGVASLATATVLYFLRPTSLKPVEVDVGILPRGGLAATVRLKTF